jgi:hypothetical protein
VEENYSESTTVEFKPLKGRLRMTFRAACSRLWNGLGTQQVQTLVFIITAFVIAYSAITAAKQVRYSADQIKLSAAQIQASTVQNISKTSRELFMSFLSDPDLSVITNPSAENTNPTKVDFFVGALIQHYCTVFHFYQLGTIPDPYWKLIKNDCEAFFALPTVKAVWIKLKPMYDTGEPDDFQNYIDEIIAKGDQ